MIKTTYPQWFEGFWKQALALKTRTLGSKADAYKVAKRLKMGAEDVELVIDCFRRYTDKTRASRRGEIPFFPDHKDLSGWLNQRHWDSEEDENIQEIICVDAPRGDKVQGRLRQIMDRSWAE